MAARVGHWRRVCRKTEGVATRRGKSIYEGAVSRDLEIEMKVTAMGKEEGEIIGKANG